MKIAIAQLNPTIGDLQANANQILELATIAHQAHSQLVLTPELSLCGYPPRDLLMAPHFVTTMAQELTFLAQKLPPEIAVTVGFASINHQAEERGEKPLFNSIALLYHGTVQHIFHKRLLPTYDVFDEHRYFEPGLQSNSFHLHGCHIGVTICEDLWNDEGFWGKRTYPINPLEELARQNLDLIINLSASPYSVGKQRVRESMLAHSAGQYQIPIIYVNQVGGNDDLIFDGGSFAINSDRSLVMRCPNFKSYMGLLELEPEQNSLKPFPHSQQPHIAPLSSGEEEEIWSALVLGVRDYALKCGFSQAVLGLSGGIDSSLVAAIAVEALGEDRVLGILMPSPYSSDGSLEDALALAHNLGMATQTLPIEEPMTAYDQTLGSLFADTSFGVAEENLQSRIRGALLMAISNKFGYLLLSTGNKSEMAVGYCTLYGDMNGGLSVIADVPKTKVFSLCRWLNRDRELIPPNVITKPPSAELRPDQVDQDSLPPYEILDDILERLINNHQSTLQIVESGHDPLVVDQVKKLVFRSEFKRRQAAPGLKITDRAFGTGWRMPIASRWI